MAQQMCTTWLGQTSDLIMWRSAQIGWLTIQLSSVCLLLKQNKKKKLLHIICNRSAEYSLQLYKQWRLGTFKSSPSRVAEQREDGQRSALIRAALILCLSLHPQRRVGVSLNLSTFNRSAWFQSACCIIKSSFVLELGALCRGWHKHCWWWPILLGLTWVQNHIPSSQIQLNTHVCISGTTTAKKNADKWE